MCLIQFATVDHCSFALGLLRISCFLYISKMRFCSAPQINLISVSVCLVILSFSDPISIAHIKYQYFFVRPNRFTSTHCKLDNQWSLLLTYLNLHAFDVCSYKKTIKILHTLKLSKVDWIIVSVIHLAIAIKCIHTIKWRTNDTGEAESFFSVRLNANDIKWDFCKATQKNKKKCDGSHKEWVLMRLYVRSMWLNK